MGIQSHINNFANAPNSGTFSAWKFSRNTFLLFKNPHGSLSSFLEIGCDIKWYLYAIF